MRFLSQLGCPFKARVFKQMNKKQDLIEIQRRKFLRTLSQFTGLAALGSLPLSTPMAASAQQIAGLRMASNRSSTRLVFDLTGPAKHSLFMLDNPARIVIDIEDMQLAKALPNFGTDSSSIIRNIRSAPRNRRDLRIVLDLKNKAQPKSMLLSPSAGKGYRLVVDLRSIQTQATQNTSPKKSAPLRDIVVAIDAGHGGKDPGAIGKRGTKEKDVALAVAKKLEKLIQREKGLKPVMIRSRDEYISLRQRTRKARDHNADLFISIHADAYRRKAARGSSVFTLSTKGATSEAAKWLADKENSADLFGDISIKHQDRAVASVILELAQTSTIESSLDIGEDILSNLKQIGKLHKPKVEQANFAVLKSPDIPSVLVETAFLSNPHEEKKLRTRSYQEKLAKAMHVGVKDYFRHNAPPGTIMAELHKKSYS
ncbi:MAG TPA: N-acetylmuramoyl-L-alanine amidase [Gammaproteobacteria bacterium]|nr:N-acetylmuramoyl-L-alanine amidase [Gammaproteobacteria bacterium]